MLKDNNLRMRYNLQFFAEKDEPDEPENNEPENNEPDDVNAGNENNEKMFTQEQVNSMMAKEKKQGKNSVLKSLGFKTEEDAKKAFNLLKALTDSQKSNEQIIKDDNDKLVEEKQELEDRAMLAEAKLSCVLAGVNKDSVDDVITIALSKITDDENLDKILEKMKKEKRYSSFFVQESNDGDGTGGVPGHSGNKGSKIGDYGKRLAEARKRQNNPEKKSSYFD